MIRKFLQDRRGNYALATIAVTVPLLGALALAVDYSEMSRERELTLNALDAAGIATARRLIEGASATELQSYARNFFNANIGNIDPSRVRLSLVLPAENTAGGGTLKIGATLQYDPLFFDAFQRLRGETPDDLDFSASSEIKLKNTIEVALVLDNSGSMDYLGSGSGKKRMVLLREAAKQLVDTLSAQSAQMKQLQKPVQFGLVPFAASVNVGPTNENEGWMDRDGISPIRHENFNWASIGAVGSSKYVENVGNARYARGADWGALKDTPLTRTTLYKNLQRITGTTEQTNTTTETYCKEYGFSWSAGIFCKQTGTRTVTTKSNVDTYASFATWAGCVEARPYPLNINDTPASTSTPATLFVPMFAPDETDQRDNDRPSNNNWWLDGSTGQASERQSNMAKYFTPAVKGTASMGLNEGPNASCSTKPITPLTDVSKSAGVTTIKNAIDSMASLGATNVPEGMAWGWRVLSSAAPFTGGRPESEKGNDRVVIVLTDGENTYYTPDSVRANEYSGAGFERGGHDLSSNKSIYSNYGYTKKYNNADSRLFQGTSTAVRKTDFTNENYTKAMNEHFAALCTNAKTAGLIVMTVALDLNGKDAVQKAQIDALSACASDSRFRKDSSGKAAKLFWNATGSSLADDFKSIADELSNLRIVS